jgi:hypothetical protein
MVCIAGEMVRTARQGVTTMIRLDLRQQFAAAFAAFFVSAVLLSAAAPVVPIA